MDAELDQLNPGDGQGAAAHNERDWLLAQLPSTAGLGGRVRSSCSDQPELAHAAAGRAIRRAIARIAEADAVLVGRLRPTVRTAVSNRRVGGLAAFSAGYE